MKLFDKYYKLLFFIIYLFCSTEINALNILHISDVHFNPFDECKFYNIVYCQKLNYLITNPIENWRFDNKISKTKQETNNYFLIKNLKTCLGRYEESIDIIIVSGDLLAHEFKYYFKYFKLFSDDRSYTQFTLKTIDYVLFKIHQQFPKANLYFTLGNNDTDTEDYYLPSKEFINGLTAILNKYTNDNIKIDINGGYYSTKTNKKYHVVALNTNVLTNKVSDLENKIIARSQLKWFESELIHNKNIILLAHIPFGIDIYDTISHKKIVPTMDESIQRNYLQLIKNNSHNISVILSGHFHSNYIQQIDNTIIIGTIALNTYFGNNAGAKIITIDGNNFTNIKNIIINDKNQCLDIITINQDINTDDYITKLSNNDKIITDSYRFLYNGNYNTKNYIMNNLYWNCYYCFIKNFEVDKYKKCLDNNISN